MPASHLLVPRRLSSEINVTPLVDVCLVLLIIFMVVTPMMREEGVKLPQTQKPLPQAEREGQLTLSIAADGSVYVERSRIPRDRLLPLLKAIHAADSERRIVVKGDRRLRYEQVRELMELLQKAGFSRAGLSVEKSG